MKLKTFVFVRNRAEVILLVFAVVVLTLHVHDSLSSSFERAATPYSDSLVRGLRDVKSEETKRSMSDIPSKRYRRQPR